jgi:hypothetical protein
VHEDLERQVPEPLGVEQGFFVQHLISPEPGQSPDVRRPEQQLFETDTQTPSTPPALHVAVYGHDPIARVNEAEKMKECKSAIVSCWHTSRRRQVLRVDVEGRNLSNKERGGSAMALYIPHDRQTMASHFLTKSIH